MDPKRLKDLPARSMALIADLDRLFPHRCIQPGEAPEDAHRYAGKRELIDYLLDLQRADEDRAARLNQKVTLNVQ